MYERILFPTDGSEGSEVAKRHAENIAETYGSEVHVLYVADRSNEPSQYVMRDIDTGETGMVKPEGIETDSGYTAKGTGKLEALEQRGADLVGSVAERFADRGLAVTTAVLHGEPYRAITTYAAEQDADLIVMATHGRRGLDRYLLGSVTEKVVRTADVPVLTVRLQE